MGGWGATRQNPHPADAGDVLQDELSAIRLRRRIMQANGKGARAAAAPAERDRSIEPAQARRKISRYNEKVHALEEPLSALCLSGGGIRSAAFALGVVQGLAAKGVLPKFDYLSTVSGGGYLGCFLTAWVQREGYGDVVRELTTGLPATPDTKSPLRHLRRYSNYLTPRKGPLTADTLTVAFLYVRNLILNWLILIPVIICAILLVKILSVIFWKVGSSEFFLVILAFAAIMLIGLAVLDSLQQRPGWESVKGGVSKFQSREMIPMLLGGIAASCAALTLLRRDGAAKFDWDFVAALGVLAGILFFTGAMIAFFVAPPPTQAEISTRKTVRTAGAKQAAVALLTFTSGGVVTGLCTGLAIHLVGRLDSGNAQAFALLGLGPPMLIAAFFAGELLHVGVSSYVPWADGEREWLARAAGYHARAAAGWMLILLVVFGGSYAVFEFAKIGWKALLPTGGAGGLAGVIIALLGKASATAATIRARYNTWLNWSAATILAVATPVFVLVTLSFLSAGLDWLVVGEPLTPSSQLPNCGAQLMEIRRALLRLTLASMDWVVTQWPLTPDCIVSSEPGAAAPKTWMASFGVLVALVSLWSLVLVLACAASGFINTNRFSLHGLYRNRLIRAFLGASSGVSNRRQPNPFTDFDEKDNINLAALWPNARRPDKLPPQLLVANMALNVVATKDLAWQERKALSFTATPRWIGCGGMGPGETGYYRPAFRYGGASELARSGGAAWDPQSGMSLGTAMTISGAAASPNMGYHSSPALSVLLTFFNVRLGAWLGNPGPAGSKVYPNEGPTWAAVPLIQEAFGLTTDDKEYVYLSDGGHFENLGLYEMVRRRCRLIVVSDAGCDPNAVFDDLGNAVRKISVDLNVDIKFRALTIGARKEPPVPGTYCAVADIFYPESAAPGLLLYIKPGYQGIEPASVRSYAAANPAFPHESTNDQWFGESQFEAYRALGKFVIETIDGVPNAAYAGVEQFIRAAANLLARPSFDT